jgi:biotin synthase-related radical SAM superfamily protein
MDKPKKAVIHLSYFGDVRIDFMQPFRRSQVQMFRRQRLAKFL